MHAHRSRIKIILRLASDNLVVDRVNMHYCTDTARCVVSSSAVYHRLRQLINSRCCCIRLPAAATTLNICKNGVFFAWHFSFVLLNSRETFTAYKQLNATGAMRRTHTGDKLAL